MIKINNPILSGFYPDPSICRVGEDFYLVNSSFSYFPGVPIWHSKDLANWKQIGNVLDRESQIPLKGCRHSEGIFAPTIRYNAGIYYMITTNVSGGGNFIVTATNPSGPWSEPYLLGEDARGIDPSLFFDDNGDCYYVGTRPNPEGVRYNGDWEIWVQKIDLESMKLTGKTHAIWKGALRDVIWPEGPHLYHKDGYYYLMIAEGGTGPNHAVTTARSKHVFGPYENNITQF
jgi:alpha-N-arabinofuranosidase